MPDTFAVYRETFSQAEMISDEEINRRHLINLRTCRYHTDVPFGSLQWPEPGEIMWRETNDHGGNVVVSYGEDHREHPLSLLSLYLDNGDLRAHANATQDSVSQSLIYDIRELIPVTQN